jgi:hypothetical protein
VGEETRPRGVGGIWISKFGRSEGDSWGFRGLLRARSNFETSEWWEVSELAFSSWRLGAWGHSFLAGWVGLVGREAGAQVFPPPRGRLDLFVGRRRSDLTWHGPDLDGLDLLLLFGFRTGGSKIQSIPGLI